MLLGDLTLPHECHLVPGVSIVGNVFSACIVNYPSPQAQNLLFRYSRMQNLMNIVFTPLQESLSGVEKGYSEARQQADEMNHRLLAIRSRDKTLQAMWVANRRKHWAARIIQKQFRHWRMTRLHHHNQYHTHVSIQF